MWPFKRQPKYKTLEAKIRKMQAKSDINGLIGMLRSRYSKDDWKYGTRSKSIIALGEIGDERAVQPLAEQLVWYQRSKGLSPKFLPQKSLEKVLDRVGKEKVLPELIAFLKRDLKQNNVGIHDEYAIRLLGKIGDVRAVETLIDILNSWKSTPGRQGLQKTRAARRAAAEALGKIGDARAIEPLEAALNVHDRTPLPGQRTADGRQMTTDDEYVFAHGAVQDALKKIRKTVKPAEK